MKITKEYLKQIIKEELEQIEETIAPNSVEFFRAKAKGITDPSMQNLYINFLDKKDAIEKAKANGTLNTKQIDNYNLEVQNSKLDNNLKTSLKL